MMTNSAIAIATMPNPAIMALPPRVAATTRLDALRRLLNGGQV